MSLRATFLLASVVAIADTTLLLIPKLAYIDLKLSSVVDAHAAERRDGLRRCALFDDFDESELESFVKVVRMAKFERNTVLLQQGDAPTQMYILLSGLCSVLQFADAGANL